MFVKVCKVSPLNTFSMFSRTKFAKRRLHKLKKCTTADRVFWFLRSSLWRVCNI